MNNFLQAIVGFRETERKFFNKTNTALVDRLKAASFPTSGIFRMPLTCLLTLIIIQFETSFLDSNSLNLEIWIRILNLAYLLDLDPGLCDQF